MKTISVGPVAGRLGEKVSGFLDVPAAADAGTQIPVTVITGMTKGPVLALVAGTHGSEPSPIVALQRVRAELNPAELSGAVILVQIANLPSFVHRTVYRGPWDQKNLNRVFPGHPQGTVSERIAYAITTCVIDQCDALVDMHSGDANEALRPYSYWNKLGIDDAVDARARDLALAFGLDHIVVDRNRPRDRNASVFCANTAQVRGKPAVTTEAGEVGVPTTEMVDVNVRGAFRVMRHLGMLAGAPQMVLRPRWIEPSQVLTSPATGTWHPMVKPDQTVERDTLLGRLTNFFGEAIADVRSPMDGVVLYIVASPAMSEGEPIGMVGQIKDSVA
jgi:predicted deacylase